MWCATVHKIPTGWHHPVPRHAASPCHAPPTSHGLPPPRHAPGATHRTTHTCIGSSLPFLHSTAQHPTFSFSPFLHSTAQRSTSSAPPPAPRQGAATTLRRSGGWYLRRPRLHPRQAPPARHRLAPPATNRLPRLRPPPVSPLSQRPRIHSGRAPPARHRMAPQSTTTLPASGHRRISRRPNLLFLAAVVLVKWADLAGFCACSVPARGRGAAAEDRRPASIGSMQEPAFSVPMEAGT
jgi:hypothetical protein